MRIKALLTLFDQGLVTKSRKLNMKPNLTFWKKLKSIPTPILALLVALIFPFQNCSQFQSTDTVQFGSSESLSTPPVVEVPPLPIPTNPPVVDPKNPCAGTLVGGKGLSTDPYIVSKPCDLAIINKYPSAYWKLANDIDFSKSDLNGLAFVVKAFTGKFDGNFRKLQNFKIDCLTVDCGTGIKSLALFQAVSSAKFQNLYLENFSIKSKSIIGLQNLAGLVGSSVKSQYSKIKVSGEIHANGDINYTALYGIGALVGSDTESSFNEISAALKLSDQSEPSPFAVGVMGGRICNATITNSIAEGHVRNVWMAGGLIGGCGNGGSTIQISNSVFTGSVNYFTKVIDGKIYGGWGPCTYMSGLGEKGFSVSTITNSFWTGGSQCADVVKNNYVKPFEITQATFENFDPSIWILNKDSVPNLKWIYASPDVYSTSISYSASILPNYDTEPNSMTQFLDTSLEIAVNITDSVDLSCDLCTFDVNKSEIFQKTFTGIKGKDILRVRHLTSAVAGAETISVISITAGPLKRTLTYASKNKLAACAAMDKRIFLTHETFNGNLGGLAGADSICQNRAESLNLGGNWKAYLSETLSPLNAVAMNTNYCSLDLRQPVIQNQIIVGAFKKDVLGYSLNGGYAFSAKYWPEVPREMISIWTGRSDYNCSQWTSNQAGTGNVSTDAKNFGRVSAISFSDSIWKWFQLLDGAAGALQCSQKLRVACYEQ